MLESLLRPAGAALWGQMKTNAVRASESERGGMRLLVEAFAQLKAEAPHTEIHHERYLPAVAQGVVQPRTWTNHHLSAANERADSVGPYRKSLRYLVSRAFEDDHKTPLPGMQLDY